MISQGFTHLELRNIVAALILNSHHLGVFFHPEGIIAGGQGFVANNEAVVKMSLDWIRNLRVQRQSGNRCQK